jgi:hypothetical protein
LPTFRSKEIVDARQFDGSIESAREITAWFKEHSHGYLGSTLQQAIERSDIGGEKIYVETPKRLQLSTATSDIYLEPTDWLIRTQDGFFKSLPDYRMSEKYEQV